MAAPAPARVSCQSDNCGQLWLLPQERSAIAFRPARWSRCDHLPLAPATFTGQLGRMWHLLKPFLLLAVLTILAFGGLEIPPVGLADGKAQVQQAAVSHPCPPTCLDHSNMPHDDGQSCAVCMVCTAIRETAQDGLLRFVAASLDLRIPFASMANGPQIGFDPPPPRA